MGLPDMSGPEEKWIDAWTWAKRQAIVQMELSFGAKEIWRIIESFESCYSSHWWFAEKLRKSPSAVRRYLRELKQGGYIQIDKQFDRRGQTSNRYTVLNQEDLMARANQIHNDWSAKQKWSG
jgi:response regulator of citrate/malate metabolism